VSFKLKCDMFYRIPPEVTEARKLPGWATFHKVCGRARFFFDHPDRDGKRGAWTYPAWAWSDDKVPVLLVKGTGATVIEALADAHNRCGRATDDTREALAALVGRPRVVAPDDDFDALLGDSFEDL
jgi:hypothetical protein